MPIWGTTMLEVRDLSAAYGAHPALHDVSLEVNRGEIVVILGANGAGKSTLLRAIAGVCEGDVTGDISIDGQSLSGHGPDEIVELGISLVPEGRGIFSDLTVRENLYLGAYSKRARDAEDENLARVLALFPKLEERQSQIVRTMSGGEQQMVAIGRAMMSAPKVLMLDEPSLGLSPILCRELFQNLASVKELGIGVLLVEQNAKQSLAIADRGYLLENTRITHADSAARLVNDPAVQAAYLGVGARKPPQASKVPDTPAPALASRDPTPRRAAEEQIGVSIDDLVSTATQQSAAAVQRTAPAVEDAANRLASDRLSVVMRDIEDAAKNARRRSSHTAEPAAIAKPEPETDARPPVIEIYRRPRVEVYRRRPSGDFERD